MGVSLCNRCFITERIAPRTSCTSSSFHIYAPAGAWLAGHYDSSRTGALEGVTRMGSSPNRAPLQSRAALALSYLANSTKAMLLTWL